MKHNHSDLKNLTSQKCDVKLSLQPSRHDLSMTKWEPSGRHLCGFKMGDCCTRVSFQETWDCLGYPSNGLVDCLPHFYRFILSLLFVSVDN